MPRYKNGTPSYTAATLPDPASLPVGQVVSIGGDVSYIDTSGRAQNKRNSRQSNVATRMFAGRFGDFALNAAGNTFEFAYELPVGATAVQWIFANSRNAGGTTSAPNIQARCYTPASISDAALDAAAAAAQVLKFDSATSATLTAANAVNRKKYTLSDWFWQGSSQFVACRVFVSADANPITIMGNGTDDFSNWASRPTRKTKMRRANGNFVTTNQTGFTAAASSSKQCPIVGLRYMTNGRVVTVAALGDSITEGRGTYIGEGFILPACEAISDDNVTVEYCNLGWSSSNSPTFANHLRDLHSAGIYPDVVLHPNGTPNDITTTISDLNIQIARGSNAGTSGINASCPKPAQEIIWTWLPSNTTVKPYGATDSLRAAHNAYTLANLGRDVLLFDAASFISGVADGEGQMQMKAGSTTDNIHPNDTGNLVDLAPNLVPLLRQACVLY